MTEQLNGIGGGQYFSIDDSGRRVAFDTAPNSYRSAVARAFPCRTAPRCQPQARRSRRWAWRRTESPDRGGSDPQPDL